MALKTKLTDTHFLIGAVIILILLFVVGKCSLVCGGFKSEGYGCGDDQKSKSSEKCSGISLGPGTLYIECDTSSDCSSFVDNPVNSGCSGIKYEVDGKTYTKTDYKKCMSACKKYLGTENYDGCVMGCCGATGGPFVQEGGVNSPFECAYYAGDLSWGGGYASTCTQSCTKDSDCKSPCGYCLKMPGIGNACQPDIAKGCGGTCTSDSDCSDSKLCNSCVSYQSNGKSYKACQPPGTQ